MALIMGLLAWLILFTGILLNLYWCYSLTFQLDKLRDDIYSEPEL